MVLGSLFAGIGDLLFEVDESLILPTKVFYQRKVT